MVEQYDSTDYDNGDTNENSISTSNGSVFTYLPRIFSPDDEKILNRYVEAHDSQFDGFDGGVSYTKLSRYVQEAEGDDLEEIGKLFGTLGEIGDRNKEEYRTYLTSLINSFNARGTRSGVKFAIAAAANTTHDNVIIDEDFDKNEYEISVVDVDSEFVGSTINELAELADPSGVKLASPPIIVISGEELLLSSDESSVIETRSGLGSNTLTLDGQSTLQ